MTSQPAGGTQPAAPDTAAPANQALAHPAPVHHVVRRTRIGGTPGSPPRWAPGPTAIRMTLHQKSNLGGPTRWQSQLMTQTRW